MLTHYPSRRPTKRILWSLDIISNSWWRMGLRLMAKHKRVLYFWLREHEGTLDQALHTWVYTGFISIDYMCDSKSSYIECYLPFHWTWQHQWFASSCLGSWSHPSTSHLQVWSCLPLEMEYLIFYKEASPGSQCDFTHNIPSSIVVYLHQVDMAFCNHGMHGLIPINMNTEWQCCTTAEQITCQNVINIEFSFGLSNLHHLSLLDVHPPLHEHVWWSNCLPKGGPLIKLDDLFND